MIPRKIHYCWFGPKQKPELVLDCARSWSVHASEFAVKEWNEETFDLTSHRYARTAYAAGKYAFVSDYVRAWALYEEGGIYLDTDVELRGSLEPFLAHEAFSGFERPGMPFTAVWGARRGHSWPARVLGTYEDRDFSLADSTNTLLVSDLLESNFGIRRDVDGMQYGDEGVVIYPSSRLCVDLPQNTAVHHFLGSWLPGPHPRPYKEQIQSGWFARELIASSDDGDPVVALKSVFRQLSPAERNRALLGLAAESADIGLQRLRSKAVAIRGRMHRR